MKNRKYKKNRKKRNEKKVDFPIEGFEFYSDSELDDLRLPEQITKEEERENLKNRINENTERLDILRDKIAEQKGKDDDLSLKKMPPIIINNKTTNVELSVYISIALIIIIILMLYIIYTAISTLSLLPFSLIQ